MQVGTKPSGVSSAIDVCGLFVFYFGGLVRRDLGAVWTDHGRCRFRLWAPLSNVVDLHIVSPEDRRIRMNSSDRGYHQFALDDIKVGTRYVYGLSNGFE